MKLNAEEDSKADCCLLDYSLGVMLASMRDELRQLESDCQLTIEELKANKAENRFSFIVRKNRKDTGGADL